MADEESKLFTLREAERLRAQLEPVLIEALDWRRKLGEAEEQLGELAERIQRAATRMTRLVGDLRDAERKNPGTEDAELAIVLTAGLVAFYTCAILAHSKILNIFWIIAGLAAALRRVALTQEPSAAVGSEQGIAPEIGREPERIDRIIGQPGAARIGT